MLQRTTLKHKKQERKTATIQQTKMARLISATRNVFNSTKERQRTPRARYAYDKIHGNTAGFT